MRIGEGQNKIRREEGAIWDGTLPMKDNRGFTLMELIIVMVIMGILAVGGMAGFNLLNRGSAKNASEQIITKLDYVQLENMTKSKNYTLEITKAATGEFVLSVVVNRGLSDSTIESSAAIDMSDGQITYENNLDEVITVSPSQALTISFRKDTGGVKEYSTGKSITRIGITSSGTTYYIRLVTATGKHFIE